MNCLLSQVRWIASRSNGPWQTAKPKRPRTGSSARSLPARRRRTARRLEEITTRSVRTRSPRNSKTPRGASRAAKPDFQAEMRKHVHVWKLCGRDRRGPGIAAHLFDDREVLMDAEETIKDLGFKRGQMAEMREEEDRQGRIALAPLRPVAARLGAMCLAVGSDLLFQSAGRAIAALNTPARLPPKAPTKENEEEKVHKRVAAVSKAVVRAASAVALRGCLSNNRTALKARLCARPDWSDAERDEWRFVLTGEVGPATDPVEVDYTALKTGNNLVGGAKRRL